MAHQLALVHHGRYNVFRTPKYMLVEFIALQFLGWGYVRHGTGKKWENGGKREGG